MDSQFTKYDYIIKSTSICYSNYSFISFNLFIIFKNKEIVVIFDTFILIDNLITKDILYTLKTLRLNRKYIELKVIKMFKQTAKLKAFGSHFFQVEFMKKRDLIYHLPLSCH